MSSSLRQRVDAWFDRHEVPWELVMAALAVLYVALGFAIDGGLMPVAVAPLEAAITATFVVEFTVRCWAAPSRRRYVIGHVADLVALLPAARGLRVLRLLRLVRLLRSVPLLYRASGIDIPIVRRIGWHLSRVGEHLDRRLVSITGLAIASLVVVSALFVTVFEKPWTAESFIDSVYWATNTVLGSGDTSYVASPIGWLLSWSLIVLGLTILAIATGAVIGFIIDIALKEGRGMGAAGYRDHTVVCGWNGSARELIDELSADEYATKIVLLAEGDSNPAGRGVYFVSGDPTQPADLERAGITNAAAALVFPSDASDEADMRSILVILAIETMAPGVRTIAEVNNSRHVDHFRRAGCDEVLVPSQIAAHLAARSALYPGLTELITDIVSGGEGSELYRIQVPKIYVGVTVDEFAARLMREHRATLMAISRGGSSTVNPPPDLRIEAGDDALVVAESIASLTPLEVERATPAMRPEPA